MIKISCDSMSGAFLYYNDPQTFVWIPIFLCSLWKFSFKIHNIETLLIIFYQGLCSDVAEIQVLVFWCVLSDKSFSSQTCTKKERCIMGAGKDQFWRVDLQRKWYHVRRKKTLIELLCSYSFQTLMSCITSFQIN